MAQSVEAMKYLEAGKRQISAMLGRWEDEDGEFRSYVGRRIDMLKMLGTGNASGLFAVAAYLTTGTRIGGMGIAAKVFVIVFFAGVGAFVLAFRNLYRFELDVESALLLMRGGKDTSDSTVAEFVKAIFDRSEKSGVLIAIAFGCLLLGGIGCGVSLLFM